MANVLIDENTMTAIGDAIRGKTGKDELMLPADMPGEIEKIKGAEYEDILARLIERTTTRIIVPSSATFIGDSAFRNCYDLEAILLTDNITDISAYAFSGCSKLEAIELSKNLKSVENMSFQNCNRLHEITFKSKQNFIKNTAFNGCTSLTTINVPWSEGEVADAPWGAVNATINYNYTESEDI